MKQIIIRCSALLLVVSYSIVLLSCKKDNDDTPAKTKTELLTAGSWKFTNITTSPAQDVDGDGDKEANVFDHMLPCIKDNFLAFKSNGAVELNEGPTRCHQADPQTFNSTWNFVANETGIIVNNAEYILVELSATMLKMKLSYVGGGVTYTDEVTYGH